MNYVKELDFNKKDKEELEENILVK